MLTLGLAWLASRARTVNTVRLFFLHRLPLGAWYPRGCGNLRLPYPLEGAVGLFLLILLEGLWIIRSSKEDLIIHSLHIVVVIRQSQLPPGVVLVFFPPLYGFCFLISEQSSPTFYVPKGHIQVGLPPDKLYEE